jgi:metal-responsive CopG/Arc/MetJ family transcriptional regulator
MSEKMVRTQVYLPQEIYDQLKFRADEEGVTMATQIREALAEYVVKSQKRKSIFSPRMIPSGSSLALAKAGRRTAL